MNRPCAYLVDTGWIIHHLRGHEAYSAMLLRLRPQGLAVSIISLAELYEGVARAKDSERAEQQVRSFLTDVEVLPVDEAISRQFGNISAALRKKGFHPGDFDVLIAATAMHYGLQVLTSDKDDFSRFEGLKIITEP